MMVHNIMSMKTGRASLSPGKPLLASVRGTHLWVMLVQLLPGKGKGLHDPASLIMMCVTPEDCTAPAVELSP